MWQMGESGAHFLAAIADSLHTVVMVAYSIILVEFIVRYVRDAPVQRHVLLFNRCRRGRRGRDAALGSGTLAETDKQSTDFIVETANKRAVNLLLMACSISTLLIFIR
jgi:hypothetical protein